MKKYSELTTANRGNPCQEYPGQWVLYIGEKSFWFFHFENAYKAGQDAVNRYDSEEQTTPLNVSICWRCSNYDPRIGNSWFSGFYRHGRFNAFGQYVPLVSFIAQCNG